MRSRTTVTVLCIAASTALGIGAMNCAQAADSAAVLQPIAFDIKAQPLASALNAFAVQSHQQILFTPEVTAGKMSRGIKGTSAPDAALAQVLAGTGLASTRTADGMILVSAADAKEASAKSDPPVAPGGATNMQPPGVTASDQGRPVERLEEVIVTAQKRKERLMDVPLSVSAFTNKAMEDTGSNQLSDFLANAPGVGIIDSQNGQGNTIEIRGISSILGDPAVGYYLDELPIAYIGNANAPDVRTYDLERVEVLRGPQGTLYGDSSIGGTVRILTKDPDLHTLQGNVDLIGSGTEGGSGSYSTKGMLNLPLKEDLAALRLVASKEDFGGWIDNTATATKDANDRNITTYRAKLRVAPTDNLDVIFSVWHDTEDADGGAFALPNNTVAVLPIDRQERYTLYSGTIRYHFSSFDLLSATSKMKWDQDASGTIGDPPFQSTFQQTGDDDVVSEELRLTSNTVGIFRWTGGLFYRKVISAYSYDFPGFAISGAGSSDSRSYAAFGEGTWSMLDKKLDLTLGMRYFKDRRGSDENADPATLALVQTVYPSFSEHFEVKYNVVSPRLNLAFHANDDWLLFTNVTKGFRAGGAQGAAELAAGIEQGQLLPVLISPETLWSYEIGTKGVMANGRVQFESSLFYDNWRDLQANTQINQAFYATLNSGAARTYGVEVGATWIVLPGLTLRVAGSELSAKYTQNVAGSAIKDGVRVDNVPQTSLSAGVMYRWPLTSALHGFAEGNVQYTSDRTDVLDAAPPSDPLTMVNTRLGVEGKRWGTYLFVDNLTNEDGAIAPANPLLAGGAVPRPRPRTYGLNVRFNFQ